MKACRSLQRTLPVVHRSGAYVTVARWVEWASDIVKDWPDDVLDAPFDRVAAEESVRLAESITAILEPHTHSSNA